MIVGVLVIVGVCVAVAVGVTVGVTVAVGVDEGVAVGSGVDVTVGSEVGEGSKVAVGVALGVGATNAWHALINRANRGSNLRKKVMRVALQNGGTLSAATGKRSDQAGRTSTTTMKGSCSPSLYRTSKV